VRFLNLVKNQFDKALKATAVETGGTFPVAAGFPRSRNSDFPRGARCAEHCRGAD